MKKFILKSGNEFLHFEMGGIVTWHNINPDLLCAFDSRIEAVEIIDELDLQDTYIVEECFTESFFA